MASDALQHITCYYPFEWGADIQKFSIFAGY